MGAGMAGGLELGWFSGGVLSSEEGCGWISEFRREFF